MALGQIAGGISQIIGAGQMKKAARDMLAKGGEWQDYQISEQAKQMLGEAQARRGAQMPGMGIMQAQQAGSQANILGAAARQAGGGANFMALAAALGAQGQQAGLNLSAQQAQFNEAQQQQLNQARGIMMGEEQAKFQNQLGRFQYYNQMGNQLREAARAQTIQGIAGIGQGLESAATFVAGGGLKKDYLSRMLAGNK
jgi:hypothetical protein